MSLQHAGDEALLELPPSVCEQDARGLIAQMTDKGWELLQRAAHSHVNSVREHLVDVLTPAEFEALGKASEKLVHALGATVEMPK